MFSDRKGRWPERWASGGLAGPNDQPSKSKVAGLTRRVAVWRERRATTRSFASLRVATSPVPAHDGQIAGARRGRVFLGGLLFATMGTLFLVPTSYSLLKKHPPIDYTKEIDHEAGPELSGGNSHGTTQEQPA